MSPGYVLADPNDLPVIEVAFVNGQESPTIETAEDFNVLGRGGQSRYIAIGDFVKMRGHPDFGVALREPSAPRVEAFPFTWRRGGREAV